VFVTTGRLDKPDGIEPKTAFSRFPPIHRADFEGRQRVDFVEEPRLERPR
jgi:hypothetical protein